MGAPAWPTPLRSIQRKDRFNPPPVQASSSQEDKWSNNGPSLGSSGAAKVKKIIENVANNLIKLEEELYVLDSGCGDGDCGATHARGARALLDALPKLRVDQPGVLLQQLGVLSESMGGSSGGVYSLLFTGAARAFQESTDASQKLVWIQALRIGLETVMKYGGAEPGDRTMIDALYPALAVLEKNPDNLAEAVTAARAGAERTASMTARAGRASYVSKDKVNQKDPGAVAA